MTIFSNAKSKALALALTVAFAIPCSAFGTSNEDVTFVTPIYEGILSDPTLLNRSAASILETFKSQLGTGGSNTKLGWSFSAWVMSRDMTPSQDYAFNSSNLDYALGLATNASLPVLIHSNNGRWADCCQSGSTAGYNDALLNYIANMTGTTQELVNGTSVYGHDGGSNYFSLSRYNSVYRQYKKRNTQAAMTVFHDWALAHPDLFVGVSLDSETLFASSTVDYGNFTVTEWRDWLTNTGLYGPGGDYFGSGRIPAYTTIQAFNSDFGQNYTSFDQIRPPSPLTPGEPYSEEWQRWRITTILHEVSDQTLWIAQAGLPRSTIFGHQTPEVAFYDFADALITATAALGASGYTTYGRAPVDYPLADAPLRGSGQNNWGIFELNPLSNNTSINQQTMIKLFEDGIKTVCPNAWEANATDQYSLFNSPNYQSAFGDAVNQFLANYSNTPRNTQPPPWNPGDMVFDFYTAAGTAGNGSPNGTSGGVPRKTITGNSLNFTVSLPAVTSGQRLNLRTDVGIKEGAAQNQTGAFLISINSSPILGSTGIILPPTYFWWTHWMPLMIDITAWAGQTVNIELKINQTTDGLWGSPAIYASNLYNQLAYGKAVNVSSSDSLGNASLWNASRLTNGEIDGTGWSSASHNSSNATEWASVNLGGVHNISKVVLHPRADLNTAAGTGFPTAFTIQGSKGAWTDQHGSILSNSTTMAMSLRGMDKHLHSSLRKPRKSEYTRRTWVE